MPLKKIIKKNFILALIFVASLYINNFYLDWSVAPSYFNDTNGYLQITNEISQGKFPSLAVRSPVYPIFLLIPYVTHSFPLAVKFSLVLTAFSFVLLYKIFFRLTKNKWLSVFSVLFINLDYSIIQYQAILQTESISIPLFIILFYLHLIQTENNQSKKHLVLTIIFDVLIILLRPSLIIIPISFYIVKIILTKFKFIKSANKKIALRFLSIGLFINLSVVVAQSAINYTKDNMFAVSDVSQINMLGKFIQYNYLDKEYTNPPDLLPKTVKIFNDLNKPDSPHVLLDEMTNQKLVYETFTQHIYAMNQFIFENNKLDFHLKTLKLIPQNFKTDRSHYVWYKLEYQNSKFVITIENIFNKLNQYKLICFLISTGIAVYLFTQKQYPKFICLALILASILSTIVTITYFSYDEYDRLKIHIEPFLDFLVIYSIYFIFTKIIRFLEIK